MLLVVLLFYIPTLFLLFPLIRKISLKRCENIKLIGHGNYRFRMFVSGYIFTLLIFVLIFFLAALVSCKLNIGVYYFYNYAAAFLMFLPVFFAAIDIPFTTKINKSII